MPGKDILARLPDRRGWTLKEVLITIGALVGVLSLAFTVYINVRSEARADGSLDSRVNGAMAVAQGAKTDVATLRADTDRKFESMTKDINLNQTALINKIDTLTMKVIDLAGKKGP